MLEIANLPHLRPIHPFPARMAPSIVWAELPPVLPNRGKRLCVLDPMAGSGTTIATARLLGHRAIGLDTDPLAVLIARAWSLDVDGNALSMKARQVVERARERARQLTIGESYPPFADEETREFVRYWFDATARRHLTALSASIRAVRDENLRTLLWCAFSRLIIVKSCGASRAMDLAHSRPHRVYDRSPLKPLEAFEQAARLVGLRAPFRPASGLPPATILHADARHAPLECGSVDVIVTSPPYLNAIDYLRGHKFSLIWMGRTIADLRGTRAANVGTEIGLSRQSEELGYVDEVLMNMGDLQRLPPRAVRMLRRYVVDLDGVLAEMSRVLREDGRCVMVVGDSNLHKIFVSNSGAITSLGKHHGLELVSRRSRPLPTGRRYLPPPGTLRSGSLLEARMREEVILSLRKAG
ncbi:MAG TPA: hypothetical protein VFS33_02535 [Gemmatimonadales bacterium]|nr:hypothetical protein [Gemmatimonadales bacterium]